MSFKKISNKEYEIQIGGRTQTIFCPFGKVSLLFTAFVENGGVIDPVTGQVQNDIISLISSFKSVGDILLSEYDKEGELVKRGNCADLEAEEVISLFLLASEILTAFILGLTAMKKTPETPN